MRGKTLGQFAFRPWEEMMSGQLQAGEMDNRSSAIRIFDHINRWLLVGIFLVNSICIILLNLNITWTFRESLTSNLLLIVVASFGMFAVFAVRSLRFMVRAKKWRYLPLFVSILMIQLYTVGFLHFSPAEFLCTTRQAHKQYFQKYDKTLHILDHACIPDGYGTM